MSDQGFRYDNGSIIGYGLTLPAPSGVAFLTADHLNRLVDLLREQKALGDDDGARIVAQEKRERARIEAVKADLMDDLGIEAATPPHDPHDHAAALIRQWHVPRFLESRIVGCACGWVCPKIGPRDSDDAFAEHVAREIAVRT